jgi:hypothetical protein
MIQRALKILVGYATKWSLGETKPILLKKISKQEPMIAEEALGN